VRLHPHTVAYLRTYDTFLRAQSNLIVQPGYRWAVADWHSNKKQQLFPIV
jgi:hypothetical protein